jgi:hypothetical protein
MSFHIRRWREFKVKRSTFDPVLMRFATYVLNTGAWCSTTTLVFTYQTTARQNPDGDCVNFKTPSTCFARSVSRLESSYVHPAIDTELC